MAQQPSPARGNTNPEQVPPEVRRRVIVIALSAALGGVLFGYDSAVINGAVGAVSGSETGFGLSPVMTGLSVSGALLGCALGAWIAGTLADRFGRVRVLVAAAVMFLACAIVSAFAPNFLIFLVFRFIGGLGVGFTSVIGPAYIAEIAPTKMRGFLTSFQQFAIGLGILGSVVVNAALASASGGANNPLWFGVPTWRWMLFAMAVPAVIMLIASLRLPETPRYLVMKGDDKAAEQFFDRTGQKNVAAATVAEIKASVKDEPKPTMKELRGKSFGLRKVVWIAIGVALFQQLCGINIVLYYDSSIWQSVGFSEQASLNIAVLRSLAGMVVTIASMFLVDRMGRRKLLMIGSLGMTVFLIVATVGFFNATITETGLHLEGAWAPLTLAAVYGFFLMFCFTWGPVMWIVIAEILPNNIRAVGVSVAATANWIGNFAVSQTFPMIEDGFGIGGAYLLYAVFAALSWLFVKKFVPETSGVALEDMAGE